MVKEFYGPKQTFLNLSELTGAQMKNILAQLLIFMLLQPSPTTRAENNFIATRNVISSELNGSLQDLIFQISKC